MTTWFVLIQIFNPRGTPFDFGITTDPFHKTSSVTEVDAAVLTTSLSNDCSIVENKMFFVIVVEVG